MRRNLDGHGGSPRAPRGGSVAGGHGAGQDHAWWASASRLLSKAARGPRTDHQPAASRAAPLMGSSALSAGNGVPGGGRVCVGAARECHPQLNRAGASRAELGPELPAPTPESQILLSPEPRLHRTPPAARTKARLPGRGSEHRHKHLSLTPRGPGGLLAALFSPVSPEVTLGAGTWLRGRCLQQRSWRALPPWCTASGSADHSGQT